VHLRADLQAIGHPLLEGGDGARQDIAWVGVSSHGGDILLDAGA
jgi:hypothetical protein